VDPGDPGTPGPPVRRRDEGGVATLTLARPANRNALSAAVLEALDGALADVGGDRAIRVVVLDAEGPAFSAGHDLRELAALPDDAARAELFDRCSAVMVRIGELPQPVIAKVAGVATAAGCQLVASCDLAVAGASARFATPGVDIGLFCSTPAVAVTRTVAPKHAMELLLTGELVGADHAFRIGLVNRVVPDDELDAAVAELAALVASKPAAVVALGKAALRRQRDLPVREAYAVAGAAMVENLGRPEAVEGIAAFLEKRPPRWDQR
jgi:enoyl-CoA hydratase/carnithine racemase